MTERPAVKPMFATPMHDGRACLEYLESMEDLLCQLSLAGVPFARARVKGDSHVERARNTLHAKFLESDATHLCWVDSDVGFRPQDAVDMIAFLAATGEGLVGGPYVNKDQEGREWPWAFEPLAEPRPSVELGGKRYVPVRAVGTGFLFLSRAAAEKLAEGRPRYRGGSRQTGPIECADVYRRSLGRGKFDGEDFDLCLRWAELGGTTWLAADAELSHSGDKTFRSRLTLHRPGEPAREVLAPGAAGE